MGGFSQWYSVFGVWEIEGAEFGVGIIGIWEAGVCAVGEEEALGASWGEGFMGVLVHGLGCVGRMRCTEGGALPPRWSRSLVALPG